MSFVSERSKAEGKVVGNLKSSDMLKEDRKDMEKLRALVDNWALASRKLNLLSEEMVWYCDLFRAQLFLFLQCFVTVGWMTGRTFGL